MLDDFKFWFQTLFIKRILPPPLERMQLKPNESAVNPLMVRVSEREEREAAKLGRCYVDSVLHLGLPSPRHELVETY